MSGERKFRSAINGFNRQDVAGYIEAASARAAATRAEKEKLQKKCAELETALSAAEETASVATARCAELEARLEELQAAYDQACRDLEDERSEKALLASASVSGEELLALRRALEESEEKLEQKEEELSRCAPQAAEYEAVKERVASLELSASRRAVEIEREAEEKAAQLLQDARQADAAASQAREAAAVNFCNQLRKLGRDSSMRASLLRKELAQLAESLGRLSGELDEAAAEFDTAPRSEVLFAPEAQDAGEDA